MGAESDDEATEDMLASMDVDLPHAKKCARCCHKCFTGRPISKRLERRLYTVTAAVVLFTVGTVRSSVVSLPLFT